MTFPKAGFAAAIWALGVASAASTPAAMNVGLATSMDKVMIRAIHEGFPQREIHEASYQYQKAIEAGEQTIVGVNEFVVETEFPIETLQIGEEVREEQVQRLRDLRTRRSGKGVKSALSALQKAARDRQNVMPFLISATREYATLGEMCDTLREVYGTYQEPAW